MPLSRPGSTLSGAVVVRNASDTGVSPSADLHHVDLALERRPGPDSGRATCTPSPRRPGSSPRRPRARAGPLPTARTACRSAARRGRSRGTRPSRCSRAAAPRARPDARPARSRRGATPGTRVQWPPLVSSPSLMKSMPARRCASHTSTTASARRSLGDVGPGPDVVRSRQGADVGGENPVRAASHHAPSARVDGAPRCRRTCLGAQKGQVSARRAGSRACSCSVPRAGSHGSTSANGVT